MEFPDEQPQFNPLRNRGSDRAAPTPLSIGRGERGGGGGGGGQSPVVPSDAVPQLITRLQQEIAEANPSNAIYFTVDFLCQNYPEHLEGFADIFHGAPDLEEERTQVAHFFALHKIGLARSSEFCKAGYDTLDSLMLLSADDLNQIETANGVEWPPGHKIRLQQVFHDIQLKVKAFKAESEKLAVLARAAPKVQPLVPNPYVSFRPPNVLPTAQQAAPATAIYYPTATPTYSYTYPSPATYMAQPTTYTYMPAQAHPQQQQTVYYGAPTLHGSAVMQSPLTAPAPVSSVRMAASTQPMPVYPSSTTHVQQQPGYTTLG